MSFYGRVEDEQNTEVPKLRMDHLFEKSRHGFRLIYEDWLISSILTIKMNPLTISNKLDV